MGCGDRSAAIVLKQDWQIPMIISAAQYASIVHETRPARIFTALAAH
jgi:hypothetical protein